MSFPEDNAACGLSQCIGDAMGRGPLETCAWFPLDFAPCAFSLCWFYFVFSHTLYFLTVKDHTCGYDSVLSSMSPSSESQNHIAVLGTQHTFPLLDFASLLPLLLLVSPGSISLINCVHHKPWPGLCFQESLWILSISQNISLNYKLYNLSSYSWNTLLSILFFFF